MQRKCKQDYIMQYLRVTRNGTLKSAIDLTAWQALSQFNNTNLAATNRFAVSKYLFNWWGTLHAQCKRGNLTGDDADICGCKDDEGGSLLLKETQWHLMAKCTCKGYTLIRKKYAIKQQALCDKYRLNSTAASALLWNLGIQDDGTYPEIDQDGHEWALPVHPVTVCLLEGSKLGLNWFQRGPLPAKFVSESKEVLGIGVDSAVQFCTWWFDLKWKEGMAIWRKRNGTVHNAEAGSHPLYELRSKVRALILDRRRRHVKTPADDILRRMGRTHLQRLLDSEVERHARQSILAVPAIAANLASAPGRQWFLNARQREQNTVNRLRSQQAATRRRCPVSSVMNMASVRLARSASATEVVNRHRHHSFSSTDSSSSTDSEDGQKVQKRQRPLTKKKVQTRIAFLPI